MRLPVFLVEDGLITDAQVRRLREKRMSGKTLAAAAAAAGMSERTARHWQSGALPSTAKAPRTWRTREDPFAGVWESEVVPQLVADTEGRLQVLTLFTWLCRRHPGRFQAGQLRTLQRRVRDWRVQYGPDREVYFEQVAVPGREAAFDFTDASDLGVTIRGVAFPHLLFEWVLSYSTWTYVGLAFSETFEALVAGRRGRCCRGVADLRAPERHRSGRDHGFDRDVHGAHLSAGSWAGHLIPGHDRHAGGECDAGRHGRRRRPLQPYSTDPQLLA